MIMAKFLSPAFSSKNEPIFRTSAGKPSRWMQSKSRVGVSCPQSPSALCLNFFYFSSCPGTQAANLLFNSQNLLLMHTDRMNTFRHFVGWIGICLTLAAHAETSDLWGANGEHWTPQSRLPDFSFAGYHCGEAPIPNVPARRERQDLRRERRCCRRHRRFSQSHQ